MTLALWLYILVGLLLILLGITIALTVRCKDKYTNTCIATHGYCDQKTRIRDSKAPIFDTAQISWF